MNANMGDKSQRLKPLYDDQYGTYVYIFYISSTVYYYKIFLSFLS